MSLDVYLKTKNVQIKKATNSIFIRENGQTKEICMDEWLKKNPNIKPVIFKQEEIETNEVFTANITHNLGIMANEANVYMYLWRPEEINITKAKELINPLREGLHILKSEPEKFKKLNPSSGWGNYEILVEFIEKYLNACYKYSEADIVISR